MRKVSVIVPCYNEEATIQLLLEAIQRQTISLKDLEVIIADGMSKDNTRKKITAYSRLHQDLAVRIVDNPAHTIPAALNKAIAIASGEIIIRLDAHSVPARDYIKHCVSDLEKGFGRNVGGRWEIKAGGPGWMARSIAAAAANPIGVGDAVYRYGEKAGEVDTVPFGAYYRKDLVALGGYNENLLTNEDYELNMRIKKMGGRIWFDPAIRSAYFARSNLGGLAKQYFRYGFWKRQMLRRFPGTIRLRQLLPPVFVASLILCIALAIFIPRFWIILVAGIALYVVILMLAGLYEAVRTKTPAIILGVVLAIATMHFSWGTGFLISLFRRFG